MKFRLKFHESGLPGVEFTNPALGGYHEIEEHREGELTMVWNVFEEKTLYLLNSVVPGGTFVTVILNQPNQFPITRNYMIRDRQSLECLELQETINRMME